MLQLVSFSLIPQKWQRRIFCQAFGKGSFFLFQITSNKKHLESLKNDGTALIQVLESLVQTARWVPSGFQEFPGLRALASSFVCNDLLSFCAVRASQVSVPGPPPSPALLQSPLCPSLRHTLIPSCCTVRLSACVNSVDFFILNVLFYSKPCPSVRGSWQSGLHAQCSICAPC